MQARRFNLTYTRTQHRVAPSVEIAPRNQDAARLALRIWIASASFAIVYELVGGESVFPAVALVAATGLLALALPSGRAVEVYENELVRRGLLTTRRVPWSGVRSLKWSRQGGEERLSVRSGLSTITLSSAGDGFAKAERRVRAIAALRGIPITAA